MHRLNIAELRSLTSYEQKAEVARVGRGSKVSSRLTRPRGPVNTDIAATTRADMDQIETRSFIVKPLIHDLKSVSVSDKT